MSNMSKEEIQAKLTELGIEYPADAKVAELKALLPEEVEKPVSETENPDEPVEPVVTEPAKESADDIIAKAKQEGYAQALADKTAEEKAAMKALDKEINDLRKRAKRERELLPKLDELLRKRAKYNASQPFPLERKQPSQMSREEMIEYCDTLVGNAEAIAAAAEKITDEDEKKKAIKLAGEEINRVKVLRYENGDTTYHMRLRIKSYRSPNMVERLRSYELQQTHGKIITTPLGSR